MRPVALRPRLTTGLPLSQRHKMRLCNISYTSILERLNLFESRMLGCPLERPNFGEYPFRDCLKKMSAARYALFYGEQKIPYRPVRRRMGTARDVPAGL